MNQLRLSRPRGLLATIGVAVSIIALASELLSQSPLALTVLTREGRRTIPISVVNDQQLVPLDELATLFGLTVRDEAGAVTVTSRGRTIIFSPDQTLASVAGRMISLAARPTRAGGRWLVPIDFISRAIAPVSDTRIDLRRASLLLVVGDLRVPRLTIASDASPTGARLTIDAAPPTASTLSHEGERLLIKFDADAIDSATPPAGAATAFVQGIRRVDPATIAIDLGPRFGSYRSSTQAMDGLTRLTLELLPPPGDTPPAAVPTPAAPVTTTNTAPPIDLSTFGHPAVPIRTVTLDPGHGGADEGVKGAGGLTEKAVTLSIARRVKTALEARLGLRVLLTREDDRELPFDGRTSVANNNKADLFISFHVNGSLRPTAAGAAIYVAQFADDGGESQPFEPHKVPVFGGGLRDIELVRWNEAQTRFVDQSAAYADILRQQFEGRIPLDTRPTDRAPLRVLASANMPAVLVELGFLSNPEQEARLGTSEFQGQVATAIVESVSAFREYLNQNPGTAR